MARLAVSRAHRVYALVDERVGVDISDLLPGWKPDVEAQDLAACLARVDEVAGRVAERLAPSDHPHVELAQVALAPPSPAPRTVFAAPVNYEAHQGELGGRSPQSADLDARQLGLIVVASASVAAPGTAIELPDLPGREFHFEGEIAVVIGRAARGVSAEDALDHVLGYTGLLDITLRLADGAAEDRSMRKSFATFTPLGPYLLTRDEVADPAELELRLSHNGALRQHGRLRDLILGVPELIARASAVVPLQPGDVIATGTPSGVAAIEPGDELWLEMPRIGCLRMDVRRRAW